MKNDKNMASFKMKVQLKSILAALVCTGSCLAASLVQAKDHVLILTISNYTYAKPLPGVQYDEKNAIDLARSLGYDTSNVQSYKEQQLAGKGIQQAVATSLAKVQAGDRLFLYYSGHGASFPVAGGCAEALVPFDASDSTQVVSTKELIQTIYGAKSLLSDAFVFFDACHSGGHREMVVNSGKGGGTRGADTVASVLSSKTYVPRGSERCLHVANKTGLQQFANENKSVGGDMSTARGVSQSVQRNFAFMAAAREDEEALDQGGKGGLATTALLQCAQFGAGNASGTGIVNLNDLKACAQQIINKIVPQISKTHKPHNMEVYLNGYKSYANVPVVISAPAAAVTPVVVDDATRTINVFEQAAANSNPNLNFNASFSKDKVSLGSSVTLSYKSGQAGYLNVLYVGSDRLDITSLAENVQIKATNSAVLGDTTIEKVTGENTFLVLLTADKLDVQGVLQNARNGKVSISAAVAQAIGCEIEGKRNASAFALAGSGGGATCGKRNASAFKLVGKADDVFSFGGYGASVLRVVGF